MRRLSHTLIAWVLLVQAVALVADNPQNTKDVFKQWVAVATFASQQLCQEEAERRTAANPQRFELSMDANSGMIVTYRYRCAED